MHLELRENTPHGTKEYPYAQYHIYCGKNAFQFPVHWHDEIELIYIKEGTLHITISDQDYIGTTGSIFFVNPKELHFMSSFQLPVSYYTLLFPLEFISFQTMDSFEAEIMFPLRSGQLLIPNTLSDPNHLNHLSKLLDEVILINDTKQPLKQLKTRILLLEILETLYKNHYFIHPSITGKTDIQRELLLYIQNNYCTDISLQDLASHIHMSTKYTSKYFKDHFDLTFSQYVKHLRITHAKKLLETTQLSITEIALCSGFSSVSYFIRSFKSYYDISPFQYKKSKIIF